MIKKALKNFLNGLAFGITETIPGVSGGTIAIILGFYDELIKTVNHFTKDYKKSLRFFIPLGLGMVTGLFIFSSIISFLLGSYSFPTMTFFIGLIVGIIPIIYSKTRKSGGKLEIKKSGGILGALKSSGVFSLKRIVLVLAPLTALIVISSLKSAPLQDLAEVVANIDAPYMVFIFFAGVVAAAALVIPGISGSFVLLLLGIYPLATYSVSSIRFFLGDITNVSLMLDICKVLAPLGIGIIIGGLSMARLIEKLLTSYYTTVYLIILGLLAGSVFVLFREPIVYQSGVSAIVAVIGALTFSGGLALSYNLGKSRFNV
jgi:putative membrane protein